MSRLRLSKLATKFERMSTPELEQKATELRAAERTLAREHRLFRERALAGVEANREEALGRCRALLDQIGDVQGPVALQALELAALYFLIGTSEEFTAERVAAVERRSGEFSPLSLEEFEAKLEAIRTEAGECAVEQERRDVEGRRQEADAELELLDKAL
jgi:hypothetical protein